MDSARQQAPAPTRAELTPRRALAVLPLMYLVVANLWYSVRDARSPFSTLLHRLGVATLCSLVAYLRAGLRTRACKVYYGVYVAGMLVNAGLVGGLLVLGREATRPYSAHGVGVSGQGADSIQMSEAMWGLIMAGLVAGVTVQGLLVLPLTRQVVEYEKEQARDSGGRE